MRSHAHESGESAVDVRRLFAQRGLAKSSMTAPAWSGFFAPGCDAPK
jgi:hypothetical protein